MTPKLAMYVRIARHHMDGTPIDENDRISQERDYAIEGFMISIGRKMDIVVRLEVFARANWLWDATGPAVRFSIDGQSFLLSEQNDACQLFLEADGKKVLLALLLGQEMQTFTDRLLVEIDDALRRRVLS